MDNPIESPSGAAPAEGQNQPAAQAEQTEESTLDVLGRLDPDTDGADGQDDDAGADGASEDVTDDQAEGEPEGELPAPWNDEDEESPPPAEIDLETDAGLETLAAAAPEEIKGHIEALTRQVKESRIARQWFSALDDPATALDALDELTRVVRQAHGYEPQDTEGVAGDTRVARLERQIAEMQSAQKADTERRAMDERAARAAPNIQREIQKEVPGFQVTAKMVVKALTVFLQLGSDPGKAVKAYYAEQLLQHARTTRTPKRAPSMVRGGKSEGNAPRSTLEFLQTLDPD